MPSVTHGQTDVTGCSASSRLTYCCRGDNVSEWQSLLYEIYGSQVLVMVQMLDYQSCRAHLLAQSSIVRSELLSGSL